MDSEGDAPINDGESADDDERAGLYLAVLIALAVPALIVLAFFLSGTGGFDDRTGSQASGSGLDTVDVDLVANDDIAADDIAVEVAGAGERQDDGVSTEIGSAASLDADTPEAVSVTTPTGEAQETSAPGDSADSPPATRAPSTTVAGVGDPDDSPATTAPTTRPTTTAPSATSSSTTSTSSTTTSTTTTSTTTTTEPAQEPAEFAQRIDIGRIGDTTLQFRFSSATSTSYVVTVRSGNTAVSSTSGGARANQLVNETVQGLTPGTDYTVQITLNGPPAATSPRVAFRTSGGEDPEPAEAQVAVQGLRLVDTGSTRFEVNYESNICANGSFVIREQGGPVVGSNTGQASGCTTRHLGIPGFWTPALKPNTTYVITVTVEANGAGKGNGNSASGSLTVTTNG